MDMTFFDDKGNTLGPSGLRERGEGTSQAGQIFDPLPTDPRGMWLSSGHKGKGVEKDTAWALSCCRSVSLS